MQLAEFPIEVIIPVFNDDKRLSLALWGYTQQTFKNFLIHIVNDGGDDAVLEILKQFPQLNFKYHYVPPKTDTYRPSLARNTAMAKVQASRAICTDTDIVPSHNLVESHLRFGSDSIVVVGRRCCIKEEAVDSLEVSRLKGTISYDDFTIIEDDYRIRNNRPVLKYAGCSWDTEFRDLSGAVAWDCWSCNISYPVKEFLKIGGLCTKYDGIWGGEDTDIAIRLLKRGIDIAGIFYTTGYHLNHQSRTKNDNDDNYIKMIKMLGETCKNDDPFRNGSKI